MPHPLIPPLHVLLDSPMPTMNAIHRVNLPAANKMMEPRYQELVNTDCCWRASPSRSRWCRTGIERIGLDGLPMDYRELQALLPLPVNEEPAGLVLC